MKTLTLLACLTLSACATCERHPYACAAGTAILVGSAIAATHAHRDMSRPITQDNVRAPSCANGACQ